MSKTPTPPSDKPILALAILAVVIGCIAYFWSPTDKYYNPGDNHHSATEDRYADAVAVMPDKPNPIDDSRDSHSEKEKEQYLADRSDLAAQWAMAKYTWVGIIVGSVGLFFILITLRESQRAAFFTEQALIATKDTASRELRPYITVSEILGGGLPSHDKNDVILHLKFQNDGATPASKIIIEHQWATLMNDGHQENQLMKSQITQPITRTDYDRSSVGPQKFVSAYIPYSKKYAATLVHIGKYDLILEVRIHFTDIYGDRWCNEHFFRHRKRNPISEAEAYHYKVA